MPASRDDDAITDEELLTGTGSGGVLASGYLREQPLIEYLGDSERVTHLLSNKKKGVRKESDGGGTAYTPGDGYQAIAAVTDTRVLFVVGDCTDDGDETFSVPYTEIEDIKTGNGVLKKRIDVWTTSGVRWRFFVRSTVDIGPAVDYLERAAVVWSRVESQLYQAKQQTEVIEDNLSDDQHDAARDAAGTARTYIEEARRKAEELSDERSDAIWGRIREVERQLDESVLDIHVSRATQVVAEAEQQWRQELYNKAYDSFLAARNQYERALDVARQRDLPETDDIRASADEVTQQIDQLSKSPLQRAEETHERAMAVEKPEVAVDLLEDTLEKYQTALVLDWGNDDQRFAGESETLRRKIEVIVDEIEAARRELATEKRSTAEWYLENQQYEHAREQFAEARDHLQAALSIAEELKPELTTELTTEIRDLEDKIDLAAEQASNEGFQFLGDAENTSEVVGSTLTQQLETLEQPGFSRLVARIWSELGWDTTHQHDGPVDVVATKDHPLPEKQLFIVETCNADESCGRELVSDAQTVRDRDRVADVVVVVTNSTFTERARELAADTNVKLVDCDRLCDILDAEDVTEISPDGQPVAE